MDKLHAFETKTWEQIKAAGCHPIQIADLAKPARDRLVEIKRDDIDKLMSFRLTGTERVWCVKDVNIMSVLWWDPDHLVYEVPIDRADRTKARIKGRG